IKRGKLNRYTKDQGYRGSKKIKKKVDSIKNKEKDNESSKEELDKGKHPFVASVMGAFLKHCIGLSSKEEDPQEGNVKLSGYIGDKTYNFPIASIT
ncbi:hypothetical protein A2U01_0059525, partial [Trifolium medium]|nr:hypothetical protein [Trifolium medium]